MISAQTPIGKFDYVRFFYDYPTAYLDTSIDEEGNRTTTILYDDGVEYLKYEFPNWKTTSFEYMAYQIYQIHLMLERVGGLPKEAKDLLDKFLDLPEVQKVLEKERQRNENNKKVGDTFDRAQKKFEDEVEKYIIKD